jgi:hypothetical protein
MAKLLITETIHSEKVQTVRLAAGTNTASAANTYDQKEQGKIVKFVGESRYALAAAGDQIEGFITTVEGGRMDDYSWGGKVSTGVKEVTFDGLEATAGTGTVALGDFVVCGTVVAAGTALSAPAKVCKATNQPGVAIVSTVATADTAAAVKVQLDAVLALAADAQANSRFAWKVVSLGSAGTGAVGTTGMIERV